MFDTYASKRLVVRMGTLRLCTVADPASGIPPQEQYRLTNDDSSLNSIYSCGKVA